MLKHKENSSPGGVSGGEISQSKETELISDKNQMHPGENSEISEKDSDEGRSAVKGKAVVCDDYGDENRWVERDFLQISGSSLKREVEDDQIQAMFRDKRPKFETIDLSLSLSDASLSLSASNHVQFQNADPSNSNNPQTTFSNDFSASLSYSYSHQFSHNPSCSMNRNSTENYDIWNAGDGTNGSVHSRFRPIGDGGVASLQGNCTNSDNDLSLFPSELVARPTSNLPSTITPSKHDIIKLPSQMMMKDEWSVKSTKKYDFDSVESLMRIKEMEARMFQNKADEARKEVEGYKGMIRVKIEGLDEEYGEKIRKLCLSESEERKKQKVEEFKVLENARFEYNKLKMKMQTEISGLLQRMENTKKLCV